MLIFLYLYYESTFIYSNSMIKHIFVASFSLQSNHSYTFEDKKAKSKSRIIEIKVHQKHKLYEDKCLHMKLFEIVNIFILFT